MNKYLNTNEYDILSIILHSEEPLNVPQIIKLRPDLTANIVQPAIRKLLKFNLIEVADITLERNIFSRRFQLTADAPDIIRKMFLDDYTLFRRLVSEEVLLSAMMQADKNPEKSQQEISELEQLLKEYKGKNSRKGS